jgi:hypothetical protein
VQPMTSQYLSRGSYDALSVSRFRPLMSLGASLRTWRGPRLLRSGEDAKALMRRPIGSAWVCVRGHLHRERQGRAPPGLEFFAPDRACERIRAKACRCYKRRQQVFIRAYRVGGEHHARLPKPRGCQQRTMIPWGRSASRCVSNQKRCSSAIGTAHGLVINSLSWFVTSGGLFRS